MTFLIVILVTLAAITVAALTLPDRAPVVGPVGGSAGSATSPREVSTE